MKQTISNQSISVFRFLFLDNRLRLSIPLSYPFPSSLLQQSSHRSEILAALPPSFVSCTLDMSACSHLNRGKITSLGIQAKQKPEFHLCLPSSSQMMQWVFLMDLVWSAAQPKEAAFPLCPCTQSHHESPWENPKENPKLGARVNCSEHLPLLRVLYQDLH